MSQHSHALACTEGGSDKVYMIDAVPQDGGYIVTFRNGRRGGTLRQGIKTPKPVPFDEAVKIADKLAKSKIAKGYRPIGDDATSSMSLLADAGEDSGIRPQLLNPVTEQDVQREGYVESSLWIAQEKHDGERRMIVASTNSVRGVNRKGFFVPLPTVIVEAISRTVPLSDQDTVIDGEIIGDVFYVFDLLQDRGECLRDADLMVRLNALVRIMARRDKVTLVFSKVYSSPSGKQSLIEEVRQSGREGVVFKRREAVATAGKPNSGGDWLKLKFYETATVRTASIHKSKRSVGMEVLDASGLWVGVGNVTVPANLPIPSAGDLIEVRYLNYNVGGSIYQPQLLGIRTDLDEADCVLSQLKVKGQARTPD